MYALGIFGAIFAFISARRMLASFGQSVEYLDDSIAQIKQYGSGKTLTLIGVVWLINVMYLFAVGKFGVIPMWATYSLIGFFAIAFFIEFQQLEEKIKYSKLWFKFDWSQNCLIALLSAWVVLKIFIIPYVTWLTGGVQ